MKTRRALVSLVAGCGLALGTLAPAASAAPVTGRQWVATPNGVVGVQQYVTLKSWPSRGKVATVTFTTPSGATNAGQAAFNAQGYANLPWTPNLPGTWSVAATGAAGALGTTSVVVAAVPTSTVLLVPGEVQASHATTIVAQVSSQLGSIAPSGTITVRNQTANIVATGTLVPSSSPTMSVANIEWTPAPGPVSLTATFTPSSAAFGASVAPVQSPLVGGVQTISLRTVPEVHVGVPVTVTGVVGSGIGYGSASLELQRDGFSTSLSGSRPTDSNGLVNFTWTPTQAGVQSLFIQFSTNDFGVNGRDTQAVNVLPAPAPNTITVTPAGAPAWGPGNVGTLGAGSSVTLTPTSASGGPVPLATSGPCVVNAGVLTVLSAGTCTVTATSAAAPGYAAATAQYTVTITAPAKRR